MQPARKRSRESPPQLCVGGYPCSGKSTIVEATEQPVRPGCLPLRRSLGPACSYGRSQPTAVNVSSA